MHSTRLILGLGAILLAAGCDQTGTVDINGDDTRVVDGNISVSPTDIDLGMIFLGKTADGVITVNNVGGSSAEVRLEVAGGSAAEYVITPLSATIVPDGSSSHVFTLTPTTFGNKTVSVFVQETSGNGNIEVTVRATVQEDNDGDGFGSVASGGDDCNDNDATVHSGATEVWYDGVDQDCAGDDDYDQDADGVRSGDHGGTDCDDTDATVYPGAADAWYDGVDSDCVGNDDYDQDDDGYSSADYGGEDCDDLEASTHPGAADAWYDGVDSDCAGNDDYDADADGYTSDAHGGDDCDDDNDAIHPGATETWYDGIDQDCAGDDDYDQDGDGTQLADDCDDEDATIQEPTTETLDGRDEDCDGYVDDFDIGDLTSVAMYGPDANIEIGNRATFAMGGDFDDDGTDDIVVLSEGSGSSNYGNAWIVSGADAETASGDIDDYDTTEIDTESTYYRLRHVIGPMVDIDGDGTDDVLISAHYNNSNGYGYFYSGADLSRSMDVSDRDARFTLGSSDMSWVTGAGDIDGDGTVDIVQGSPRDNLGGWGGGREGNLSYFNDGSYSGNYDNDDVADELHGDAANDYLGYTLTIADLDGDGYEDILTGAPYNDEGASNGGSVYVFLGGASTSWGSSDTAEDHADITISGGSSSQNIGYEQIPQPGDVDGDGDADLMLASESEGYAWLFLDAGSLSGNYEVDADEDYSFSGSAGHFASAVVINSDMDGDGDDEIVIGGDSDSTAGTNRGLTFRFDYDSAWSSSLTYSDASATVWGDTDGDYLGTGLAGGSDLDGDGNEDILIGAMGQDGGSSNGGAIYVLFGW